MQNEQRSNATDEGMRPESRLRDANEQLTLAALRVQEQAEESEARYLDLLEGLDAIVWEAHADPWGYTFVSQRAQAILGYPVERWLTEPNFWVNLIHPEDREQAVSMWKEAVSARKDFRVDYRAIASDGRIVWLAMLARLRRPESRATQFRGLLFDVGDSIRAEMLGTLVEHQTAELLSRQKQLRGLATELNLAEYRERTKLATELHDHLAQLLVLGLIHVGQAQRVVGDARACGDFLRQTERVLDQSLEYTRTLIADLSPSVLREFGLVTALRWLAEHMQRYQLAVAIEAPESLRLPPITEGQAVLLFQSVRELLINVAKHGHIDRATVRLRSLDGILRLEVQDAGCGFDLLQTLTPSLAADNSTSPTSSKFGLFSIGERMTALGGRFDMDSSPGKGTIATLILPLTTSAELAEVNPVSSEQPTRRSSDHSAARRQYTPQDHSHGSIRVLLVDDHLMLRQGLRSIVDGVPHLEVVGEASNGLEAIDAVRVLKPDVVVMDINMPLMNGIEATRHIKKEFPNTAVIGLSVHEDTDMAQRMRAAGLSRYVTKESAVEDLCDAIDDVMRKREPSI